MKTIRGYFLGRVESDQRRLAVLLADPIDNPEVHALLVDAIERSIAISRQIVADPDPRYDRPDITPRVD